MGACSSCLGRRGSESNSDASPLLQDPDQPGYGTTNSHSTQPDPEELRRQRETLERICAETSEQLIPVSQPALVPEVAEMPTESEDYARLFNDHFSSIQHHSSRPPSSATARPASYMRENVWLDARTKSDDEDEVDHVKSTKGNLTVRFGPR